MSMVRPRSVGLDDDLFAVALRDAGDACEGQIAIEDADKAVRDREHLRGRRKSRGDRFLALACLGLCEGQLLVEPRAKFGGEFLAQLDLRAATVLLVARVKREVRHAAGEVDLAHGDRRKLALPEASEDERLVDEGAFAAEAAKSILAVLGRFAACGSRAKLAMASPFTRFRAIAWSRVVRRGRGLVQALVQGGVQGVAEMRPLDRSRKATPAC